MQDLKSRGAGILDCIIYAMTNQECDLGDARNIVINSDAWIANKDGFLRQQEEALQEFLEDNPDRIASVQQVFAPDGTQTTVNLKPSD